MEAAPELDLVTQLKCPLLCRRGGRAMSLRVQSVSSRTGRRRSRQPRHGLGIVPLVAGILALAALRAQAAAADACGPPQTHPSSHGTPCELSITKTTDGAVVEIINPVVDQSRPYEYR